MQSPQSQPVFIPIRTSVGPVAATLVAGAEGTHCLIISATKSESYRIAATQCTC